MKTPATEEFPEIKWQQKQLIDKDVDERSETWLMEGWDAAGIFYTALGEYTHDELVAITEIEFEGVKKII